MIHPASQDAGEQGYALIAALWLLLLAASLAGVLMLRTVDGAKSVAAQRTALIRAASEESALQTAAADLLLNGNSSRFGALPSTARYQIGETELLIAASRESDRLDVNDAPLSVIDAELQQQGLSAKARSRFLAALLGMRSQGQRLESVAEIGAQLPAETCVLELLTPHAGRTDTLLAGSSASAVAGSVGPSAWRLRVVSESEAREFVVRPGLAGQQPLLVIDAGMVLQCGV